MDYFAVARAELLKRGDIKTQSQSSAGGNWSVMEETGAVRHLTVLLKQFYTGLVRPSVLVPQARLLDRAAEIIEVSVVMCLIDLNPLSTLSVVIVAYNSGL